MLRVRRDYELALAKGHNAVLPHEPCHTILGTEDLFFITQMIPDPRTAVIFPEFQIHPFYLNEQFLIINSMLTFKPPLIGVIAAP